MFRAIKFAVMSVAILVCVAGCTSESSGPKQTKVKGSVTLDGQPMPSGEVMFFLDGHITICEVKDGNFSGDAGIGENTVQIYSYRQAEVIDMGGEKLDPGKINFLPAQYNANSTLKASVAADKANEFKFEVTSM